MTECLFQQIFKLFLSLSSIKNKKFFLVLLFFFCKSCDYFIGKMIQLQVHLQLPCYDFCFLYWRNVGELSSKDRISACPITCIAPSSETTTGGVYKWQGRNRHSLMSYAYEIFLVTRPIIAILGPNWVDVIPVFPRPCGQAGPTKRRSSCSHWHCSARVAQSIEEHHRPAVAQNFT